MTQKKQTEAATQSQLRVAIVGATGLIGRQLLEILTEKKRAFPYSALHLLASERSVGKRIEVHGQYHAVTDLKTFDFSQADLVFFCAGSALSRQYAATAIEKGCWVIDQSSLFRYEEHIPLIIPEINGQILESPLYEKARLIANPNCSTIQLLMSVYPIAKQVNITRLDVATYQAVSGAGYRAQAELIQQSAALLNLTELNKEVFDQQIAFNVLPKIDEMQDNGFTREEMKVVWETEKILGSVLDVSGIEINVTAARVPVLTGHAEAVHIQTEQEVTAAEAGAWLKAMPGVELVEDPDYPTPISDAANHDAVFVGRLRQRLGFTPGLNWWVVADNLRKGGSLNAVQIAELLLKLRKI